MGLGMLAQGGSFVIKVRCMLFIAAGPDWLLGSPAHCLLGMSAMRAGYWEVPENTYLS